MKNGNLLLLWFKKCMDFGRGHQIEDSNRFGSRSYREQGYEIRSLISKFPASEYEMETWGLLQLGKIQKTQRDAWRFQILCWCEMRKS